MNTQAVFTEGESIAIVRAWIETTKRTFWRTECGHLYSDYNDDWARNLCRCGAVERIIQSCEHEAILVGSLCENGLHAPALDIDLPAELEIRGSGRSLLKIDVVVPPREFFNLTNLLQGLGISSKCHAAGILLDCPAKLIPSSTPGHFHLYLSVCLSWHNYEKLLAALADAGIIQKGYYATALHRKQTYLRPPGVRKDY